MCPYVCRSAIPLFSVSFVASLLTVYMHGRVRTASRTTFEASSVSLFGPGKLFQLGTIYILFKIFQLDHLYSRAYSSISWNIWTPTAPWRAHGAPKIAQRCAKLRKIAPKQSENGRLLPHGVSYYVILTRFKCIKPFGSSKDKEGLCL